MHEQCISGTKALQTFCIGFSFIKKVCESTNFGIMESTNFDVRKVCSVSKVKKI